MARQFFVGGNWKLNGTKESIKVLVDGLNAGKRPDKSRVELLVAPPVLYLPFVRENLSGDYHVSAQNCWKEKFGAFTGEISIEQLKDFGINWVILGHSERRNIFGESSELIGEKTRAALDAGLFVVFCCGELLAERESGKTEEVVYQQISVIKNIKNWDSVVIAYEPVWAIGTGVVATPEQAQEVHVALRNWLATNVSHEVAGKTRIIYGGSVNAKNSTTLAQQPDIDGFLVGGASLKAAEFLEIAAAKHYSK